MSIMFQNTIKAVLTSQHKALWVMFVQSARSNELQWYLIYFLFFIAHCQPATASQLHLINGKSFQSSLMCFNRGSIRRGFIPSTPVWDDWAGVFEGHSGRGHLEPRLLKNVRVMEKTPQKILSSGGGVIWGKYIPQCPLSLQESFSLIFNSTWYHDLFIVSSYPFLSFKRAPVLYEC